jgi:hypothetical protein
VLPPGSQRTVWLGGKSIIPITPGFDSRRVVTPTIVDSELVNQTLVVTVTPRESLSGIEVNPYLQAGAGVSASFIFSSITPKEEYISIDGRGLGWWVDNPEPNREYRFSVTILLKNPTYPDRVFYKPEVSIDAVKDPPVQGGYKGSSVVAKDEILGTLTYAATGGHEWQYYHDSRKEVLHRATSGTPLVALTIESPAALSVVKGVVRVTASALSSTGVILAIECSMDGAEWRPMALGNESAQEFLTRPMSGRSGWIEWDTTKFPNGSHDLTIKTEDSNGISENKTITIIVDNSGPRFIGYSQVINFAYVVAAAIGIVGLVWLKGRKSRR